MIKERVLTDPPNTKASADTIATFERTYGVKLPAPLVEFCVKWNAGFPAETNCFHPVPKRFDEFYQEYGAVGKGVTVDGFYGLTGTRNTDDLENAYLSIGERSVISTDHL